jgi:hypothetical protein
MWQAGMLSDSTASIAYVYPIVYTLEIKGMISFDKIDVWFFQMLSYIYVGKWPHFEIGPCFMPHSMGIPEVSA